ncbi:MAG: ATP phosphoribosyltransferase regulatory subunit [Moraxella sp.]
MSILASNSVSLLNQSALFNHTKNNWLLPDGVVDLLSTEAVKQETLRHQLTRILLSHGYELISPPMIEYTESLLGYASEDVKLQTFKIIDQLTGRLMGVRADITPQIARIDANSQNTPHHNTIARYCYAGHVVYTMPKGLFGSRTPLQLGAEIFGVDDLGSDIELLDVLYTLLASTDLVEDSHIDIGHVSIFKSLCELAQLPDTLQEKLIDLYANKALPELYALTQEMKIHYDFAEDFYLLGAFGNDLDRLQQQLSVHAKQHATIQKALQDLHILVKHLRQKWHATVSVDVTGLGYHYHTGLVFNVYVENESLPLVRGGRFSNQFNHTAADKPARSGVGFSCELNRWQNYIMASPRPMSLVPYQTVVEVIKSPDHPNHAALGQMIDTLRSQGEAVVVALSEEDCPKQVTHQLVWQDSQWVKQPFAYQ